MTPASPPLTVAVAGDGVGRFDPRHPAGCRCRECWWAVKGTRGEWEWVDPPRPTPRAAPPPPVVAWVERPPCPHEGPPVEFCVTCRGQQAEWRHVRVCTHPEADWDHCTRGPNRAGLAACCDCKLHPDAEKGE